MVKAYEFLCNDKKHYFSRLDKASMEYICVQYEAMIEADKIINGEER